MILPSESTFKPLAQGNTQFALNLYQKLIQETESNLFYSPYSLSIALAMAYAGARGNTAQEMTQVLAFPWKAEKLHTQFSELEKHLHQAYQRSQVKLQIANALWPNEEFALLPEFLALTQKFYSATVFPLNYQDRKAASKAINQWVAEKTNQTIKSIVSPESFDSETELVLTNAIYFKGDWHSPFDTKKMNDLPFWLSTHTAVKIPMMQQTKHFLYMENENLQLLRLPYKDETLSMDILLPKSKEGLAALEQEFTLENLNQWRKKLHFSNVNVYFPKFKLETSLNLSSMLIQLGLKDAFNRKKADFSGIEPTRSLFLSAILHKAFIEVNEEGTEASAATAVAMAGTGIPRPPVVFRADHPFIFWIQENQTDTLLFVGKMVRPR